MRKQNQCKKCLEKMLYALIISMLICCSMTATVFAASDRYQMTESKEELTITAQGRTIIFQKLPDTDQYAYSMVRLYSEETKTSLGQQFFSYEDGMSYSTDGIAPGFYYLELYRGKDRSETTSYFWRETGIKLQIFSDHIEFTQVTTGSFKADTSFRTNYGEEGGFEIATIGRDIIFQQLPDEDQYACAWVSLYNEETNTSSEREPLPYQKGMTYSTEGVTPGVYYLELYRGETRNSTYWSYYWKTSGIRLQIFTDHIEIVPSPVYPNNAALYDNSSLPDALKDYYLASDRAILPDDKEIKALAQSITKDCKSDYEKVLKIHDWVCDNIWYDYDSFYKDRVTYEDCIATNVLSSKKAVCEGYSNVIASLLRAVGIPAKKVTGYALGVGTDASWTSANMDPSVSNHAWNEAYVDGRWVILDTTWDSDNKYENGVYSKGTGLSGHRYFDPSLEYFSYDHKITDENRITPKTVTILKAANKKNGSVKVTWEKDPLAAGYEIYRSTNKKNGYEQIYVIKTNGTVSYQDTNLTKGKTYYYKVRAYTTVNGKKVYGSFSAPKKVKIKK